MAFGFGVGDIIALTTMIVKTVEDIHDAPAELQELAERVEDVEKTLELTHKGLSHNAPARNMSNMVRLKDRVKKLLNAMKDIVIKYRDHEGRVNPFHRVMYSIWDKGEVARLVIELEERTRNLTFFLTVQTWDSLIEQLLAQNRQKQEPAKSQSSTQGPGPPKETDIQATRSDQIDHVQAVLDNVLQTERPDELTLLPDQEDISIEKEIALQLQKASIGTTSSKALIEVINKQRKQLSHAEDLDPISSTGGNPETSDLALRILLTTSKYGPLSPRLISSSSGSGRSTTAANGSSIEWSEQASGLRPNSRGDVSNLNRTFLSRPAVPRRAPLSKPSLGRSPTFGPMRKTVSWRASHSIEVAESTIGTFESTNTCYVLISYECVTTLAKYCKKRYGNVPSYANLSKIILIKDIRLKDSAANLDTDSRTKLVESIKDGIESFLKAEYHWARPPLSITDGPFRTKQIVLLHLDVKLNPAEEEAKLNDISAKTDCRIRLTDERFDSQLLSVTGRSEALPFASSLLREALL